MASFKDALKSYKTRNDATSEATPAAPDVPVNPPEAAKVLETQTVPESEGQPEPKTEEPAKEKGKRGRPAGSKNKSSEPTASTASAPATDAPASPSTDDVDALVSKLNALGYTVTLTKAAK